MPKLIKSRRKKRGLPAGSLVPTGDVKQLPFRLRWTRYSASSVQSHPIHSLKELTETPLSHDEVHWLDLCGSAPAESLETLGQHFGVHPLWLEDILNTDHRPKLDELSDHLFLITKWASIDPKEGSLVFQQISLLWFKNTVFSIREQDIDLFQNLLERIEQAKGRLRTQPADHLFYVLTDIIVDQYYFVLEELGNRVEKLESALRSEDFEDRTPREILQLKNDFLLLRKSFFPLRDALFRIVRSPNEGLSESTRLFFGDANEHVVQISETIGFYEQMLESLARFFESTLNQRTNEIVKTLTLFTSFFVPASFLAGVYGMNFKILPELHWPYGYAFFWGVIAGLSIILYLFFKKKRWL